MMDVSTEHSLSFAADNGGNEGNGGESKKTLAGNGGEVCEKDVGKPEQQRDNDHQERARVAVATTALQSELTAEGPLDLPRSAAADPPALQVETIDDLGASGPVTYDAAGAGSHGNEDPPSPAHPAESGGGGEAQPQQEVVAHRSPIFGELDENSARQLLKDSGWNVSQSLRRGGHTQWYYRTPPPKTTLLGSLTSAVAMWKKLMDEDHKKRGGGADEDPYPMVTAFLNNCKTKKSSAPRKRKRVAARPRA